MLRGLAHLPWPTVPGPPSPSTEAAMRLARLALTLAAAAPLAAQNALQHHSTNGFATRGPNGALPKSLLQRLPLDQACGRTFLDDVVVAIQDQSSATSESFTIEIRGDNPQ